MNAAVVESFAQAAPTYQRRAAVQEDMADWLARWLPERRVGRILEVGAGPGVFTRRLQPWNGPITATDAAAAMCAAGRAALPEIAWREMWAETPLPGPWDWIVTSSMLQWIEDQASTFAAWRACLAPGGRVLAGLFVDGSLPELRTLDGKTAPLVWRTPEEWRVSLKRGGLRVVRDEVEPRVFSYSSARAFFASLHQVGAAPRRHLGIGEMRRLLAAYERCWPHGDGVRATWMFYRFEAERDVLAV